MTVNLNYTLSDEVANHCLKAAGVRHVLTSRAFLKKRPMELDAELIYLEDLKAKAGAAAKLKAAAHAALPLPLLTRSLGLDRLDPESTLTVVFTSGSTGEPKGVELTHRSVGAVLAAIEPLAHPVEDDVTLGVLPFFHSFGYTATMWWPLVHPGAGVYGPNPLDPRTVGKLGEKYRPTITFATPTFLRSYLRRCTPEQLGTLNLVVVGGEKLPADLRDAWAEKFGLAPTEGYGATELSPVVSCNVPPERQRAGDAPGLKHGTIGRPLPGVRVEVRDPDTGAALPTGAEGTLHVGGPTVMKGYLNDPGKTAAAVKDGWYDTGDMAKLDADGFIHITGRLSRFSKIGGEMVPHLRIEEELLKICECRDPDAEDGAGTRRLVRPGRSEGGEDRGPAPPAAGSCGGGAEAARGGGAAEPVGAGGGRIRGSRPAAGARHRQARPEGPRVAGAGENGRSRGRDRRGAGNRGGGGLTGRGGLSYRSAPPAISAFAPNPRRPGRVRSVAPRRTVSRTQTGD